MVLLVVLVVVAVVLVVVVLVVSPLAAEVDGLAAVVLRVGQAGSGRAGGRSYGGGDGGHLSPQGAQDHLRIPLL